MQRPFPKKKSQNSIAYGVSLGLAFGAAIGAGVGAATNNPGLWLPLGTSCGFTIGLAIGIVFDSKSKKPTPRNRYR